MERTFGLGDRIQSRVLRWGVLLVWAAWAAQGHGAERNLILITLDGARVEEVFGGVDEVVARSTMKNGDWEKSELRRQYWAATAEERRAKLMPFFWKTLMRHHGSIAGNRLKGSEAKITNRHRFSYPGYSEILVGHAHDELIASNSKVQNPNRTSLEFLQEQLKLGQNRIAVFGSWDVFDFMVSQKKDAFVVNCGFEAYENPDGEVQKLNQLQLETSTPWDSVRHDAYTFRFAMAHLKTHQPRVLYLALGETDDWAHDKRYDRVLKALRLTDQYLAELWTYLQSTEGYRDNTTLVLTTDHGRGVTPSTWGDHGSKVEGAEYIWIAAAGAGVVARGEWTQTATVYQNQVAATVCAFLGADYAVAQPKAGKPIRGFFQQN